MIDELATTPLWAILEEISPEITTIANEFLKAVERHLPNPRNSVGLLEDDEQESRAETYVRPIAAKLEAALTRTIQELNRKKSPHLSAILPLQDATDTWMATQGWSSRRRLISDSYFNECDGWQQKDFLVPLTDGMRPDPDIDHPEKLSAYRGNSLWQLVTELKSLGFNGTLARTSKTALPARRERFGDAGTNHPGADRGEWLSLKKGERLRMFMADRDRATYEEVMEAVLGPGKRVSDTTIRSWVRRANDIGVTRSMGWVAPRAGRPYDGFMSAAKCCDRDYIDFLIAAPRTASCCEASRTAPPSSDPVAHDAYTRLLTRLEPDPQALYREVEPLIDKGDGVLILDDSTLDKLYAKAIEPVHRHWSGKHKSVVRGINLISLIWTDGDRTLPTDYRIYDKPKDGLSKNDHFRDLIRGARDRGFRPRAVLFDSWYSGMENLKLIRECGWIFLTQLKCNRKVDLDRGGYRAVAAIEIPEGGVIVHLEGFGSVRVFKAVSRDGDVEYWATNDPEMDELRRVELAERCWAIEEYHRALKQCCNIERCQARSGRAQRNHIGLAIRAFVRLSWNFYTTGISWYELHFPQFHE